MSIYFASSNKNKLKEATKILAKYEIIVESIFLECPEIQSNDLEEISKFSAKFAFKEVRHPVFVEDSGIFIEILNGFPGPYSSYVQKTIGNEGILKLMQKKENRNAIFKSVIAYCEGEDFIKTFIGQTIGIISTEILKGNNGGWGFDPIFLPKEGNNKTYAEMGTEEKNKISHRKKSLEKFGKWFKSRTIIS
ncbi:MAG: XTP/dITP diphosphatase [Candidatus Helarchaeota archaeon]|nr:XTP/dITP diphosphatase [Candidatus Helarchaeota archaeon]